MNEQPMDKRLLAKFAGLGAGIMIGGPMGPIVFGVTGLNVPTSATLGSCIGAVLGYVIVALVLHARQRRIDQELLHAAEAVKAEAHLPSTISIRVEDGRVILDGFVNDDAERRRAKETIETIPGVKAVINRIRVVNYAGGFTGVSDQISKEIEERLRKAAENNARGIHVVIKDSRVILEGRVPSWAEFSAAEEAAWGFPGVTDVVNHLEIATAY